MSYEKIDPGPCPVDDTPHTACTTESVPLQNARLHQTCVVVVQPPLVFSTKDYRGGWPGAGPETAAAPRPPASPTPATRTPADQAAARRALLKKR